MVVKIKEHFDKTRYVKNNDKSKNYNLRGQRNTRYHEKNYQIKRNLIISTTDIDFVNFLEDYNRYRAEIFRVY